MGGANESLDIGFWNRNAANWDRHIGDDGDRNRRNHLHPVLLEMLGPVRGLRVLDAGCGTGYLAVELARAGAQVTGVDYSAEMIRIAQRRAAKSSVEVTLRVDNCCGLESVPSGSFERLVSIYVLQDLEDLAGAVGSFRRVLTTGGRAVVIFGHPCFGNPGGPERGEDGSVTYRWTIPYFDEVRCEESWRGTDRETGEQFEFCSSFPFYHRPLSTYWRRFREAGFVVLDFDEPVIRPPYPADLTPEYIERARQCSFSVAFHLEAR